MIRKDALQEWGESNPIHATRGRQMMRGFTLVELLVAITILAMIATLGWRGLDSIVRARVILTQDLEGTRGLQLAFAQMQRDCAYIVSPMNLPGRAPLVVEPGKIVLVRKVFTDNQPTGLQVVAYHLKDGLLTRRESMTTRNLNTLDSLWTSVEGESSAEQSVVLQKGVISMSARAWVNDGNGWRDNIAATTESVMIRDANGNWRPAAGSNTMAANTTGPSGLEVQLQLQGITGVMRKVFLLGPV